MLMNMLNFIHIPLKLSSKQDEAWSLIPSPFQPKV